MLIFVFESRLSSSTGFIDQGKGFHFSSDLVLGHPHTPPEAL